MQLQRKIASDKSEALVDKIVNKMEGVNKPQKNFIIAIFTLFLSMQGRHNFKGMERYGKHCEKTNRLQFEQKFDFLEFNIKLCKSELSPDLIIAFDPSYLPKSGKKTPHKGNFWSGCLGKSVPGLEIGGLGVVDIKHNTAFHLESVQTPNPVELKAEDKSLVDHYAQVIIDRGEKLGSLSKYLVVDGYFAKRKFIDPIIEKTNLRIICKMRTDADLRYLHQDDKKKKRKRGRPKKYAGKVKLKKIDKRRFKKIYQDQDVLLYQCILWSVFLKRAVNVVYAQFLDNGKMTNRYGVFFSTDLELDGVVIFQHYKSRFQIEFLFRDAKQYTGLTHCQARSENKIHFHTNTALTAVSLAKATHYLNEESLERKPFSIANIKTAYFNELMLNLFLSNFQVDTELKKNKEAIERILDFGKIAA